MIIQEQDLTIAHFPDLISVNHQEVSQADMVILDTYHPEGIYHSDKLNWRGDLTFISQPLDFIRSKREREQVTISRQYFLDQGYQLRTTQVDQAQVEAFLKLYQATTLKKNRAIDYNAEIIIRKNLLTGIPVYLFGLYLQNQLESGLLVSMYKDEMRVMFGAKKRFDQVRGGVGGVLEMEFIHFCFQQRITKISHGISANPAGFTDTAGIFEFKTRYGFTAFPMGEWHTSFVLNPTAPLSELVFLTVTERQLAYHLLGSDPSQVKRYQSRLITQVTYEAVAAHVARARQLFSR